MDKAIEDGRCRLLRRWDYDQRAVTPAFCVVSPPSAEGKLAIVPEDLEATSSIDAEPRR
jgi:hypothetical protein